MIIYGSSIKLKKPSSHQRLLRALRSLKTYILEEVPIRTIKNSATPNHRPAAQDSDYLISKTIVSEILLCRHHRLHEHLHADYCRIHEYGVITWLVQNESLPVIYHYAGRYLTI